MREPSDICKIAFEPCLCLYYIVHHPIHTVGNRKITLVIEMFTSTSEVRIEWKKKSAPLNHSVHHMNGERSSTRYLSMNMFSFDAVHNSGIFCNSPMNCHWEFLVRRELFSLIRGANYWRWCVRMPFQFVNKLTHVVALFVAVLSAIVIA